MGIVSNLNLREEADQHAVARVLDDPRTRDRHLYFAMRPLADCDTLWDHPDHRHAARMVLWLAWNQKLQVRTPETNEMAWFFPFLHLADIHQWSTSDAYGAAAPYATMVMASCGL